MSDILIIIASFISAISTGVIAYLTYSNIKLTKEIKELQIRIAGSIIYSSSHHGAEYSNNDFKVICDRIRQP